MWRLAKSRGLFFKTTGEPPTLNFWARLADRDDNFSPSSRAAPVPLDEWNPSAAASQSNCPDLHAVVEDLAERIDPRWRAMVKQIYAGRTRGGQDRAFGAINAQGGMVAIDLEYSIALAAYVAVYDKFLKVIDERLTRPAAEVDQISDGVRLEFEQFVDEFRAGGLHAVRGNWFLSVESRERQRGHAAITQVAEAYVLAHEVAHHVLRHSSTRRDLEALQVVDQYLSRPALAAELQLLSIGQREEVQADVLALLLLAGELTGRAHVGDVLSALHGAVFALLTVGHLDDGWHAEPADEHPGAVTRIAVVIKLVALMYGLQTVPPWLRPMEETTVPRTAAVLLAYANWAAGDDGPAAGLVAALQRLRPEVSKDTLAYCHFAAVLGLQAEADNGWEDPSPLFRQA